jgi:hypothetical protein
MCVIVFLLARGVALLASRIADRRNRKSPPESRDDGWVLAA